MPLRWQPHIREYGVPICASSLAMTRSAHSAVSLPPPRHQPWTWAMTGFGDRHMDMNFCVGEIWGAVANIQSLPASHCPSGVVMCSSHW